MPGPLSSTLQHTVDGLPLALELAAAHLAAFGSEDLARGLENRFTLLTKGHRTALRRQQTLRATMDWSHDLLPETERLVLRRLAVFRGNFTMATASTVISDERLTTYGVIWRRCHVFSPAGDDACLCLGKVARARRMANIRSSPCRIPSGFAE
jgi:predicted ATPase